MRSRTCIVYTAASVIVALAAAQPAHAQNAAVLLRKGNRLFSNAEYEAAFEVFQKGYEKGKKKAPAFLRSMAFCQLKLYRHKEARRLLQEYIQKFPKAPDIKKLSELETTLETVVQTRVNIRSTPPGASIYIDAEAAGKVGTTPMELTIEPGKHLVILKMPRYFTTTRSLEIKAQESRVLAVVMQVPVDIASTPSGASVHLDSPDRPAMGKTPLSIGMEPGKRKAFIKKPGYKTYEADLDAAPAQKVSISASLALGIRVASTPVGATVEVDGVAAPGRTPLEVAAAAGTHTLTLKLPPCEPRTETITLSPGEPANVDVHLGGCGLLSMRTNINGASVVVGDRDLGQTPVTTSAVAAGKQTVEVRHPDRRPWSSALDFSDTEVVDAKVTLGRKTWPAWVMAGVAGASLVLGIVASSMAKKTIDDNEAKSDTDPTKIYNNGTAWSPDCVDFNGAEAGCKYGWHHGATASFAVAGVSAAAAMLYYWFFSRPEVEVQRKPLGTTTADARRSATH